MGAIIWIARVLIFLLLLRIILRMVFGSVSRAPRQPPTGSAGKGERAGGELVRDPNCGTYIPKARAVIHGSGADAKYFCSAKCRDEYVEKLRSSSVDVRS